MTEEIYCYTYFTPFFGFLFTVPLLNYLQTSFT